MKYHFSNECIYYVYTFLKEGDIMELDRKGRREGRGAKTMVVSSTVRKWGNSLAIRIPQVVAEAAQMHDGAEVEISIHDKQITIDLKKKTPTLEELLAKITPENRHKEIDFGRKGEELI